MKIPKIQARAIAGAGIFLLTLIVMLMIWHKPELAKDDLFKMLAQAIIVQGLVGLAMAYYFTSQHRDTASGKADDPVHVTPDEEETP